MQVVGIKNGNNIIIHESYYMNMQKIKNGTSLIVEIRKPRNLLHHRKFFGILNNYCMAAGKDIDEVLSALKIILGYVETIEYKGKLYTIPKSISFAAMDETEFNEFYDRAIEILANDLGCKREDLEEDVERK